MSVPVRQLSSRKDAGSDQKNALAPLVHNSASFHLNVSAGWQNSVVFHNLEDRAP